MSKLNLIESITIVFVEDCVKSALEEARRNARHPVRAFLLYLMLALIGIGILFFIIKWIVNMSYESDHNGVE